MRLDAIALGAAPPDDVNVLVTMPAGAEPLALSFDERSGCLVVSQLFHTTMRTPGAVGVIPHTATEAADPLQALVLTSHALAPGLVVAVRPIGVLYVTGEGSDEVTVLAVPAARLSQRFDKVANYTDVPQIQLRQAAHFFQHYRDVEEHGRPRRAGWGDVNEARRVIVEAVERARHPAAFID